MSDVTIRTTTTTEDTRGLGLTCAASGVLMLVLGALLSVHGDVPKDQWSYPQAPGLFLGSELVLGAAHLMTAAGFVGALRLRAAPTTAGRIGLWLAVAGCAGLSAGEWTSAFIGKQSNESAAATVASTIFGVASLAFAVGAILAGVVILRSHTWPTPWSWTVLASGVVIVLLVTPANITGDLAFRQVSLMVWAALFVPIGLDVARGLRQRSVRSDTDGSSSPRRPARS